jgi:hypothetical protein
MEQAGLGKSSGVQGEGGCGLTIGSEEEFLEALRWQRERRAVHAMRML